MGTAIRLYFRANTREGHCCAVLDSGIYDYRGLPFLGRRCFGLPGRVYAVIRVRPGDKLSILVGGRSGFSGGGADDEFVYYGYCDAYGGNGGGLDGNHGGYTVNRGGGGTQSAAGSGGGGTGTGQPGTAGALGLGGNGGGALSGSAGLGGGGGGSSYVEPNVIKSRMWTGWKSTGKGDGQVVFRWK
jgi:hypothetical protein